MTTLFVSVKHAILSLKKQAVKAPCICSCNCKALGLCKYCRSSILPFMVDLSCLIRT